MKKIVVIGAGFGGLSAALHLAKKGYSVEVVEKLDQAGGRAHVWESKGYRFDMGPSWYLLPEIYQEIFDSLGEDLDITIKKLPEAYKVFYSDNSSIIVPNDPKKTKVLFESMEAGAGKKLERYLEKAKIAHEIGFRYVVKKHPSIFAYMHPKIMANVFVLKPWQSLHQHVAESFTNPRLQQLLEYEAVFLGGTSYSIPALYSLVSYWDIVRGVYYPIGGFSVLVTLLEKLCIKYGVTFRYNTSVTKITVVAHKAQSVIVLKNNKPHTIPCDTAIVNADYAFAEMNFLEKENQEYGEQFWKKADITPSGLVIYLGIKKRLKNVKHHNFYFTDRWEEHARAIEQTQWPEDPSYYVCVPSLTDDVAPKGCENVFILVPLAAGLDDSSKDAKAEIILKHFEERIGQNFRDDIVVKRTFCVSDFEKTYNAYKGNAFGLGHTLKHSVVRPAQRSGKVSNLFYVGQFTHPGTGVPMAVLSGKQISELIIRDDK